MKYPNCFVWMQREEPFFAVTPENQIMLLILLKKLHIFISAFNNEEKDKPTSSSAAVG
jgi:hypothetical protein